MNNHLMIIFRSMENDKRMNFTKDTIIKDALLQYLKETNSKIDLSRKNKIFQYNHNELNSDEYLHKSLSQLFKHNRRNITILVREIAIEGGGDSIEFCDVSNGKQELINSNIVYGTPNNGINIYGLCQEKNCIAYNQEVVVHIKHNYFDLIREKNDLKCPKCNNIIIPKTVGFLQCEYKVKGTKRINYEEFNFNGIADKSGKIKYFNSKENINGKAEMIELNFEVTKYL